jgi:hypothetical protein
VEWVAEASTEPPRLSCRSLGLGDAPVDRGDERGSWDGTAAGQLRRKRLRRRSGPRVVRPADGSMARRQSYALGMWKIPSPSTEHTGEAGGGGVGEAIARRGAGGAAAAGITRAGQNRQIPHSAALQSRQGCSSPSPWPFCPPSSSPSYPWGESAGWGLFRSVPQSSLPPAIAWPSAGTKPVAPSVTTSAMIWDRRRTRGEIIGCVAVMSTREESLEGRSPTKSPEAAPGEAPPMAGSTERNHIFMGASRR